MYYKPTFAKLDEIWLLLRARKNEDRLMPPRGFSILCSIFLGRLLIGASIEAE